MENITIKERTMSKMDCLNASVAELLVAAVHEVLRVVGQAVSEYREESARTRRENQGLRRQLRELAERAEALGSGAAQPGSLSNPMGRPDTGTLRVQDWSPRLVQELHSELPETEENQDPLEHLAPSPSEEKQYTLEHFTPSPREEKPRRLELEQEVGQEEEGELWRSRPKFRNYDPPLVKCSRPVSRLKSVPAEDGRPPSVPAALRLPSCAGSGTSPPCLSSEEIKMESELTGCSVVTEQPAVVTVAYRDDSDDPSPENGPTRGAEATEHYDPAHEPLDYNSAGDEFAFESGVENLSEHLENLAGAGGREGQHSCYVCGKTFGWPSNLRAHLICHTGERPFACPRCGRSFSRAGDLKKHARVHTGERPYYCARCGKSFNRAENLKRHQKTHLGVWPEPGMD